MKNTAVILLSLISLFARAQKADTVATGGNDVFYNLNSGLEVLVDKSTWDIGFTTLGFDASIIINENKGVKLYVYSSDTSVWNSVDTTGFDWESASLYNSEESWSVGAFNTIGTGHPDYGWGTYSSGSHDINGSRIFILIDEFGTATQIIVKKMAANGTFEVQFGDLGGSNTTSLTFSKADFNSKNFVYCSLSNRQLVDSEPVKTDWHLLFTKYNTPIQAGPSIVYYPVAGVKVNQGLFVAERTGVDVNDNDTNGLAWSENITEIGYDWKTFNNSTFQYDLTPNLAYFVRNTKHEMWKIWFTKYGSNTYTFNVEKILGTASLAPLSELKSSVYPIPASTTISIENLEAASTLYTMVNMNGQLVKSGNISAQTTSQIEVSDLAKGLYIIQLQSDSKIKTHRIIVD